MNYNKLMNEIIKILILSHYEIETHGNHGNTAQEIQAFEKRAIDRYLGRSDAPCVVVANIFHARVNRDGALIFNAIERHLTNQPSEEEKLDVWTNEDEVAEIERELLEDARR